MTLLLRYLPTLVSILCVYGIDVYQSDPQELLAMMLAAVLIVNYNLDRLREKCRSTREYTGWDTLLLWYVRIYDLTVALLPIVAYLT